MLDLSSADRIFFILFFGGEGLLRLTYLSWERKLGSRMCCSVRVPAVNRWMDGYVICGGEGEKWRWKKLLLFIHVHVVYVYVYIDIDMDIDIDIDIYYTRPSTQASKGDYLSLLSYTPTTV